MRPFYQCTFTKEHYHSPTRHASNHSSGPTYLNGVPFYRVAPTAVIATSTKVDISAVKIDASINEDLFKKASTKVGNAKSEAEFFKADVCICCQQCGVGCLPKLNTFTLLWREMMSFIHILWPIKCTSWISELNQLHF